MITNSEEKYKRFMEIVTNDFPKCWYVDLFKVWCFLYTNKAIPKDFAGLKEKQIDRIKEIFIEIAQ